MLASHVLVEVRRVRRRVPAQATAFGHAAAIIKCWPTESKRRPRSQIEARSDLGGVPITRHATVKSRVPVLATPRRGRPMLRVRGPRAIRRGWRAPRSKWNPGVMLSRVTMSRLDLTQPQILAFRRHVGALDERLPRGRR